MRHNFVRQDSTSGTPDERGPGIGHGTVSSEKERADCGRAMGSRTAFVRAKPCWVLVPAAVSCIPGTARRPFSTWLHRGSLRRSSCCADRGSFDVTVNSIPCRRYAAETAKKAKLRTLSRPTTEGSGSRRAIGSYALEPCRSTCADPFGRTQSLRTPPRQAPTYRNRAQPQIRRQKSGGCASAYVPKWGMPPASNGAG